MRLPSLVFLLSLTLSLIAVTEYACRHLPARNNKGIVDTLARKNFGRDLHGRVLDPLAPIKATISLQALSLQIPAPAKATSALSNKLPLSKSLPAAPSGGGGSIINQLPPTSASKPLDTAAPAPTTSHSAYIAPRLASLHLPVSFIAGETAFLPLSPPIEASNNPLTAPPESAFLPLSTVIMPTPPPGEATTLTSGAFLPLSATTQSPNDPLTATPESAFPSLYPVISSTPPPLEAFLPLLLTTQSSNNPLPAPTQSAFLPLSPVITPTPPPGEATALSSEAFFPLSPTNQTSNNLLTTPPESVFWPLYPVITSTPPPLEAFLPPSSTTRYSNNPLATPTQSAFLPLSLVIMPTTPLGEATALPSEAFFPLSPTTQSSNNLHTTPPDSVFRPLYPVINSTSLPATFGVVPLEAFLLLSSTTQSSNNPLTASTQSTFLPLSPVISLIPLPVTAGTAPAEASLPLSQTTQSLNNLPAAPSSTFLYISGSGATLAPAQLSGTPSATSPEGAFLPSEKYSSQTASGEVPGQALTSGGQALTNEGILGPTVTSGGDPEASANFRGATTVPPAQATGTFQGKSYSVGLNGLVIIDGTSFNTATQTTATLRGGKVVVVWPTGSVSIQEAQDRAPSKKIAITPKEYIIGSFVPTILAVVYSIPWHLLASAIQGIEPFYQLQRPEGVTVQDSIALDYRASITVIATFSAITKGHFLVWLSGLISLLVLVLAPIASQTVFISFIGSCTATSGRQACSPELGVYPVAARVLQGILGFIAVSTFALAAAIKRRKSGLYSSPLSIAGLAILFQNDHVVESFRRLNSYCPSSKLIRSSLQGHRLRMMSYVDNDGRSSYGLVMSYEDPATIQTNHRTAFRGGKKYASVAVDASDASDERIPLRRQRTVSDFFIHPGVIVAFALFVAGLLALIVYYNNTGGDTAFERFMNSQSFGVGFLFTALGVILKLYWCLLDNEVRNMEPYRQLLAGDVKASDSILLAPHTNPFTGVFYSVCNGHFFNAYVSLVAILCEPLIVALSNIPFKAGLAYIAYRVSAYTSIGILSMMLLGILWMLVVRNRTPDLVRRPDTVASILLFICGSTMLDGFKGMSRMGRKDRDATVERWNKRYSMGRVIGVDTVEREGIDESVFVTTAVKL